MSKKYLNEGAEEFLNSLKPGTFPKIEEDEFLNYLIEDAKKYLNNSNKLVYDNYKISKEYDPSEDYLANLDSIVKYMVIVSIDIVGSTKLSRKLDLYDNAKIITIFSRAMGAIIHNFNGYVLKYVGDGIISFFPEPDYNGMHDNALYCAYTMKKYIIKFLNPILKEKGFPEINFRIGINSGDVIKTIVGYNKIKQHFDLIGQTINIASKIQNLPIENNILLGQSTNPQLHNFWKTKLKEIELSNDWDLKKIEEHKEYKVYVLDILF
jgi:class 3 adenylate cyclase